MRTRVLIVDDSPVVRQALIKALGEDPALEVVGTACNPLEAWERIQQLAPDVLTLDVEMPAMDGLTFLERLMKTRPMPVVMVSSKARRSPKLVMEALRAGALAVVPKPHAEYTLANMLDDLRHTLREAKSAKIRPATGEPKAESAPSLHASRASGTLIAVGSSTGGTSAFEVFARALPYGHPCVVLAQHLPIDFVPRFAERLSEVLKSRIGVAKGNEPCEPNTIWIAPATHHLKVRRQGTQLVTELFAGPPVNHHTPSCDVLLSSVAAMLPRRAVGVILTGMGADGAQGLLAMRRSGSPTFAQDRETSAVWGMPRAAVEVGGALEQVPIERMARRVMEALASAERAPVRA